MHLPEDLTLPHSSDSGGGETSTAAVQNQGDSLPSLTQNFTAHSSYMHVWRALPHGNTGIKTFFFKFYLYLFIYTQSGIHNTF